MDLIFKDDKLRAIVARYRSASGTITAPDVAPMTAELIAFLDECVTAAKDDGYEEAVQD